MYNCVRYLIDNESILDSTNSPVSYSYSAPPEYLPSYWQNFLYRLDMSKQTNRYGYITEI